MTALPIHLGANGIPKCRQLLSNRAPDDVAVGAVVLVVEEEAHALHSPPGDLRMSIRHVCRQVRRCFTDDRKLAHDRIKQEWLFRVQPEGLPPDPVIVDGLDGLEDVLKTLIDAAWAHSGMASAEAR